MGAVRYPSNYGDGYSKCHNFSFEHDRSYLRLGRAFLSWNDHKHKVCRLGTTFSSVAFNLPNFSDRTMNVDQTLVSQRPNANESYHRSHQ